MGFEELCRRRMRLRIAAIRTAIDQRQAPISAAAGRVSDKDRIDRDLNYRVQRALTAGQSER